MIAVSDIMKRKIKKIFFEVISNSKIFKIIFFNKIVNDQDFPKLTGGGLDKGGDWTASNTVLIYKEYGFLVFCYFRIKKNLEINNQIYLLRYFEILKFVLA